MKKLFTLTMLVLFLGITSVNAQVKFGVKGGLNVSSFSFDKKTLDKTNQTGFFVGPTVKFSLPIIGLGIDASALYEQQSAKLKVFETSIFESKETKETIKLQQIAIPINLRYDFGVGDIVNLYFFAGPQFGFNVGGGDKKLFHDISEWKLKTSNFSVNVGLGTMLLEHLQISVNYNIALGKTGELKFSEMKDNVKTNVWQVALGYYF